MKSKLPNTQTSIFSIMSALATKHGALNLSQGFPNFKSDSELINMVKTAMDSGYNQYAPMPGDLGLREAIVNKVHTAYGHKYNANSEITITAGATQAIFTALTALVHPQDEVIIFTPAYDCYAPAIKLQQAKVVPIQLEAPNYKVDWTAVNNAITNKTSMIIINTPHNPCGSVFSETDMLELTRIAKKHDLLVLSDEVYEHIIFDELAHQSAARFPDLATRTVITASFGKTFHNTGWKMGYCLAPQELTSEIRKVHQYNVFSVNNPIQKALAMYLQRPERYTSLPKFYQNKRDTFLAAIKSSKFKFTPSQGTYFQLLDISELTDQSDVEYAKYLTIQHKLAAIPTSVFNSEQEDHRMLRFCFAKTDETLAKAGEILCNL